MIYDAEVVWHLVAEVFPFLRDGYTHGCQDGVGEVFLTLVVAIVGDVLVQDRPKPLHRIEVRVIRRQLDQMDTTSRPGRRSPDIGTFVVGGIVPNDMNDPLIGVALPEARRRPPPAIVDLTRPYFAYMPRPAPDGRGARPRSTRRDMQGRVWLWRETAKWASIWTAQVILWFPGWRCINGGVKSGHWAARNSATLGLGVTRATRGRPSSSALRIAGG